MSLEKARGILAIFKEPLTKDEQAFVAWQFCLEYGDRLIALADACLDSQAIETPKAVLDALAELEKPFR